MLGKRMVAGRSAILMVRGAGVASAETPPKSLGRHGFYSILCRFLVRCRRTPPHISVFATWVLLEVGDALAVHVVFIFI